MYINYNKEIETLRHMIWKTLGVLRNNNDYRSKVNKILLEKTVKKLEESGFNVYTNKIIPCNDSGISLGQLVIANEMFI